MTEREFTQIVYPLKDKMFRFAFTLLKQREQAEDVVQNVFVSLWKWRLLKSPTNIEAYIMRSVRNASLDLIRRRKYQSDEDPCEEFEIPKDAPLWDEKRIVRTALMQLNERQRLVVQLKDIEGYDNEEVAQIMDISVDNVRMILCRGRKELKEKILKIYDYQRIN